MLLLDSLYAGTSHSIPRLIFVENEAVSAATQSLREAFPAKTIL